MFGNHDILLESGITGKCFYMFLKQTYNNFFLTITDVRGNVILTFSGGAAGLRGTKRRTHTAAEFVAKKFVDIFTNRFLSKNPSIKIVCVLRMKPNLISNTILNTCNETIPIELYVENLRIPHNGMRGKKLRRI